MSRAQEVIEVTLLDATFAGAKEVKLASADVSYRLYIVPARQIRDFRSHEHMSKPGIYMMLGDPTAHKPEIYIGQAKRRKNGNGTIQRVIEHINQGEQLFCKWAIMLVDSPRKFGPTELTNLENTFTLAAREAGLTHVRNRCEPSNSDLTLATRLRLDKVVENTRLMLGALGIYVFDPHPDGGSAAKNGTRTKNAEPRTPLLGTLTESEVPADREPELVLFMRLRGVEAPAVLHKLDTKTWVLKAGSSISPVATSEDALRVRAENDGHMSDGRTGIDLTFTSPSTAAMYVGGNSRSGNKTWRNADGVLLKDLI
ncbi:hypothetical protein HMPREF2946_08930 [Actinomyces sp. HMSC062G12]|nr:hypothetical protein HMPREF2946_08930 [Actinomyces sp. HMSC062G12]